MPVAGLVVRTAREFCRLFGLLMFALLLASCSTIEAPSGNLVRPGTDTNAVYIDRFSMSGRLSVRVGDRLDSVRLEWTRSEVGDTMRFFSPFGSQLALVTSTARGATLQRGDSIERAESMQALTLSLLGVAIDPATLARWVQGMELAAVERLSNAGGDAETKWSIQAENLREVATIAGGRVAGRVLAQSGEISLRLVVDTFEPAPQKPPQATGN